MARPVTAAIPHELGVDGARKRIEDGFGKLKSSMTGGMMFAFEEAWVSDERLEFKARGLGQTITGHIDIFPQHVRIEAVLPNLLASVAEAITGKMEKEGQILLEKK